MHRLYISCFGGIFATPGHLLCFFTLASGGVDAVPAYHIYLELPLRGELDRKRLEQTLATLHKSHMMLSVTFHFEYPNLFMVSNSAIFTMGETVDLGDSDDAVRELSSYLRHFVQLGFDLKTGPLWRAQLYRLKENSHVLAIVIHHIIADGESVDILMNDLAKVYNRQNLTVPLHTFADFAENQLASLESDSTTKKLQLWMQELKRGRFPSLPTGDDGNFTTCRVSRRIPKWRSSGRTTCHGVLRSAWCWLLHEKCQQEDIIAAIASSHRYEGNDADESLVGLYVNMLPLRSRRGTRNKVNFMCEVEKFRLAGLENQLPFDFLLEELESSVMCRDSSTGRHLFQSLLVLLDEPRGDLKLEGLDSISRLDARGVTTTYATFADLPVIPKFDLMLRIDLLPDHWHLTFDFARKAFDERSAQNLANDYVALISDFAEARALRSHLLPYANITTLQSKHVKTHYIHIYIYR